MVGVLLLLALALCLAWEVFSGLRRGCFHFRIVRARTGRDAAGEFDEYRCVKCGRITRQSYYI